MSSLTSSSAFVPTVRRRMLSQVAWFNRLRFLAVAAMALATLTAAALDVIDDPWPLYALCGLTLLINLGYLFWFRRLRDGSVRRHVILQIGLDLGILTAVLHFSGGVQNPVVLFYVFHTFIASLLLSARVAGFVAAVSVMLIALLGFGDASGMLRSWPMRVGLLQDSGVGGLLVWFATLALVLAVSVYFVATILARLRASEQELVGLSRQLALSEKLASIGTLAAGVSHEINNPVGVIGHKTEILRYRIADGDADELLLAEIDTIEKHVERIRAITEGLLVFSRETPFELREIEVGQFVREAADLVRVSFEHSGVSVELGTVPAGLLVAGSKNHLLQVMVNVLLNARDASRPGDVVRLGVTSDEAEVIVHVVDVGEGIPAENLDKIFDPFFTTKDVDRGTGLGLALSHGLVERHGGRILVDSEVGRGSRFSVVLPRIGES